jgi:hypothetical protein
MTKKQNVPTCILDYLFLGSKVDARNKELLEKLKITHILNVSVVRKEKNFTISIKHATKLGHTT